MPGDTTIPLPSSSGGPTLDAESYTNASSTTVTRERTASVPGTPTKMQTTLDNNSISSSGDNTVVASVGGQSVRIFRMTLVTSAPVTVTLKDGAAATLDGPWALGASGSVILDMSGEPWYVTSVGNAFVVNLSAAVQVTVTVWFTQSA